ncbi:MAG: hypothetical protein QOK37_3770 [Thermoanaerobaculia bacterium]|jgi:hypothetical protein|nr:hypothetical protein [Thermoanaerobaculia bacterium]
MVHLKLAVAISVLLSFMHCTAALPTRTFRTQEDAGTVHVAVQSVAPFDEDFINELQPPLALTDEQASAAIALTRIEEIQRFRALMIEAGLALPNDTSAFTKTLAADGSKTVMGTEERKPGDTSAIPAAPGEKSQTLVPFASQDTNVATDASLAFRANLALRQEIALLNRQVRDAAISRGTRPYVVRFLVTLSPSSRREPYNAFADVSLFATKGEKAFTSSMASLIEPPRRQVDALIQVAKDRPTADKFKILVDLVSQRDAKFEHTMNTLIGRTSTACNGPVEVVPLFVTDNLESSADNLALQSTLSAGAGAAGLIQNIAARVAGRFQKNDQDRAKTTGFNALYTVGRVSTNTLEARLGAFFSGVDAEMIPRTYNVTVLTLVPTLARLLDDADDLGLTAVDRGMIRPFAADVVACTDLAFTSIYRFTDSRTGHTLQSSFDTVSYRELKCLKETWRLNTTSIEDLRRLLTLAQTDDFAEFTRSIASNETGGSLSICKDLSSTLAVSANPTPCDSGSSRVSALSQMLWLDLVNVARRSGRTYGRFTVPTPTAELFAVSETTTVVDDGEKTAALSVFGARDLAKTALDAKLEFGDHLEHTFYATKVNASADGRRATFEFDSPMAYLGGNVPKNARMTVRRSGGGKGFQTGFDAFWIAANDGDGVATARLTYLPKPKAKETDPPVPVLMAVTSDHIVLGTDRQSATVTVSFAPLDPKKADPKKPQKVRISVSGADLLSTAPSTDADGLDRIGQENKQYVLTLRNLAVNDSVTISAFLDKEKGRGRKIGEQKVRVIEIPPLPATRVAHGSE